MIDLKQGDCLKLMKDIPDGSIDMVLADLPYSTTSANWDNPVDLNELWQQYIRIAKDNTPILLFGVDVFSAELINSNKKMYRHRWIWNKENGGSPFNAKYGPRKVCEDILVFSKSRCNYYPIKVPKLKKNYRTRKYKGGSSLFGETEFIPKNDENGALIYPTNLITVNGQSNELNNTVRVHPTQKPVSLLEYLIKTYTHEGELVLDNTMGSGSTGVACVNTKRDFIGMELDEEYFRIAEKRIQEAQSGIRLDV